MSSRPPLSAAERKLSYAKFYDLPLTPVDPAKLKVLANGPLNPAEALPIERRNDLFLPGYLPGETGFCVLENGAGYISNLTKMPGVTPAMFDWWFAWHSLEYLRYRIWDPEDHYYARQQMRAKTLDQSLPMRERTWGTVHHIQEDIGLGVENIILNFRYPHEMGYDEAKVGTDACAAMMCADGHGHKPGEGLVAIMLHFVREIEGGIELRSRFWIGYAFQNGELVKVVPDGVSVPLAGPQALFAHNIKEFGHLAAILPQVYAEEHDNW